MIVFNDDNISGNSKNSFSHNGTTYIINIDDSGYKESGIWICFK